MSCSFPPFALFQKLLEMGTSSSPILPLQETLFS